MASLATTYLVAFCAMAFSGLSALALIYTVGHLDSPDATGNRREGAARLAV
jgi:hypothetical protein